MVNTLDKKSNIVLLKSKFFIYRLLSYFSLILIPIWLQKSLNLNLALQCLMMTFYILFMIGQWFLLGKEIDHRFKIYFKVNSSIDRVVYRLILGFAMMTLYFNFLILLPPKWTYNFFWVTWATTGLFYSWPTRGKIIKESVSSNFFEFRYLDSFEKTLVSLVLILFVFTLPDFPEFTNFEALKLFFDPLEHFDNHFWNSLTVHYYPFKRYPELFKLSLILHFYFVGAGLYLLTVYAFLRYFVSRRLSLLGVFAVISTWSFSKILAFNQGDLFTTTFSLIWMWSLLWATKSSTYRAGLFLGIISYLGAMISISYSFLALLHILVFEVYSFRDKTRWYKKQFLKYMSFGLFLTLYLLALNYERLGITQKLDLSFFTDFFRLIDRKAFFSLSFIGMIALLSMGIGRRYDILRSLKFNWFKLSELNFCLGLAFLYGILVDGLFLKSFGMIWLIAFLSLIPIEMLFQTISRLRSRRNMIYLVYILVCLLDSHFEGRVKIFVKIFQ